MKSKFLRSSNPFPTYGNYLSPPKCENSGPIFLYVHAHVSAGRFELEICGFTLKDFCVMSRPFHLAKYPRKYNRGRERNSKPSKIISC